MLFLAGLGEMSERCGSDIFAYELMLKHIYCVRTNRSNLSTQIFVIASDSFNH
ncbi:MAG: hypothetical protein L7F78_17515 [Syntrophales bacterium LBB04]|nr:hypothetical protein [Syntrophales bacterium LBB04]